MPLAQNLNAFLGAAVLGVIGAAGMYLIENYRQQKMRHKMAKDLARLDQELSQVKRELDQLLAAQRKAKSDKPKRNRNVRKANSILSNSDDYMSASNMDSSDLEFYDVSDDDDNATEPNPSSDLENLFNQIDSDLDRSDMEVLGKTLDILKDLCDKYPDYPELLWRIGKAHQKISELIDETSEQALIENHIAQGIEACSKALEIKNNCAETHKWYAILIGSRSDFVGLQQKITDGHLFKEHVDIAISLNPNDASLHHMLGRFDFEVAGLKWYERKVAATLFSEPPIATYDQALEHFLEAEKLADFEWKENRLMIAKCNIALGKYKEALDWLLKADTCPGECLDKVDAEVKELLTKYKGTR